MDEASLGLPYPHSIDGPPLDLSEYTDAIAQRAAAVAVARDAGDPIGDAYERQTQRLSSTTPSAIPAHVVEEPQPEQAVDNDAPIHPPGYSIPQPEHPTT